MFMISFTNKYIMKLGRYMQVAVLGKNLMGAIQNKGTLHALKFCNEQAYPRYG